MNKKAAIILANSCILRKQRVIEYLNKKNWNNPQMKRIQRETEAIQYLIKKAKTK